MALSDNVVKLIKYKNAFAIFKTRVGGQVRRKFSAVTVQLMYPVTLVPNLIQ